MAVNALTVQAPGEAGAAPTYVAAGATPLLNVTDSYKFKNNGRTLMHFKKSGAGACTVTVVTPKTVKGRAIADHTFVVPATTGDVMVGPLDEEAFSDTSDEVTFTVSEATGLSLALIRI